MGNYFESCESKDCCKTHRRDKSLPSVNFIDNNENNSEKYGESNSELNNKEKILLPNDILDIPVRTDSLVIKRLMNPLDFYRVLETIGYGAFGLVKKVCLKTNPNTIRAMKIISKKYLLKGINDANLVEEIYILKNLDHPNIMKIYEFYADKDNVYIISEFFDQGDLLTKIEKLGNMNEIVVKFIMDQIFNAVSYLHSRGVLHGDLKLENVMLYTTTKQANQRFTMINKTLDTHKSMERDLNNYYKTNLKNKKAKRVVEDMTNYEIKLIDFGCSKLFSKKKHQKLSGIIGTSLYCSPEVVDNLYDEKCDEWSCGVIMYILLTGTVPFPGETEEEIFKKIKKNDYNFDNPKFQNVSDNCKDLIKKLLEPNINKRINASHALRHPFFTEAFNPNQALTENKDLSVLFSLIKIKPSPSKFHEAITAFLCVNYINKDEEKRLREVFRYIDKEGKNVLTRTTIDNRLKENGYLISKDELDNIIKSLDSDSNGTIEYQEFLRGVCNKESLFSNDNLKSAFDCIDEGLKGFITAKDIKNFIFHQNKISDKMLKEYLHQFGMKMEDKLTFNEFVNIFRNDNSDHKNFEVLNLTDGKMSKSCHVTLYSNKSLLFDIDDDNKETISEL